MKQENYFILLELPFDPPATDEAQIKAAIHGKQQEWSRMQHSEETKGVALRNLELIPEIEQIMLDPQKREEEAKKALDIHKEMQGSFEAELRVLEGKGYLLPTELRDIYGKYRAYGFDNKYIQGIVKVPITDTPLKNKYDDEKILALNQEKAALLKAHLELVNKRDLYTFLAKSQNSKPEELVAAARAIHHRAFHSGDTSAENAATQLLADQAMKIFEDERSKAAYDKYLKVDVYPRLNALIDDEQRRSGFISPEMLMRLVNFGVTTYGVDLLELEEHIREYCAAYNIDISMASPQTECPNCHEKSPRGTTICPHCAAPLEGSCPSCNTFFTDGAPVCLNCSFPLGDMGKALPYIEEAKSAIIEKDWSVAQRSISYIQQYWPGHKELESLIAQTVGLEEDYVKRVKQIEDSIKENRFYAAKQLVEKADRDNVEISEELKETIEQTISDFEKQLKVIRERGTISYDSLNMLASHVSDSMELSRLLTNYPPEPPTRLSVRPSWSNVKLAWNPSPSTGVITYVVVRKEDSLPLTAYDGAIIYEGAENAFVDVDVPPLKKFFYSIFSKRGNSYSEIGTVSPSPVRIIPEISNLIITPGDNAAQLTWHIPPNLKGVRIWRSSGENPPEDPKEGAYLKTKRLDGYTDVTLENGINYWYHVVAVYETGSGEIIESRGIDDSVVPHTFNSPIDNYTITQGENEDFYVVNWEGDPNQEVVFFASQIKPNYAVGKMIPIEELTNSYERLTLENKENNTAQFYLKITGGIYIMPVVIRDKFGAVGRIEYLTHIPDVENLTYDIVESDLFINFKWPYGKLLSATAAWRKDRYPSSIKQKGTSSVICSRDQYDLDAGIKIPEISIGTYYFKIYVSFLSPEGSLVYSEGLNLLVDNTPAKEFFYDITYSRKLLSSQRKVTVTIESDHIFTLPQCLLVGKVGSIPLNISDGTPLFEIDREPDIAGSITYEYISEKLPKDMYIRMFFYDETQYEKLRPLPTRRLLVT